GPSLGYSVADDTGAVFYASDSAITLTSPHTPNFDDSNPLVAKANELLLGDYFNYANAPIQSLTFGFTNEKTDKKDICATSGKSGSVITKRTTQIELVATLQQYDAD